jgi:hypothetical protein
LLFGPHDESIFEDVIVRGIGDHLEGLQRSQIDAHFFLDCIHGVGVDVGCFFRCRLCFRLLSGFRKDVRSKVHKKNASCDYNEHCGQG